jgi:hypothetical protein
MEKTGEEIKSTLMKAYKTPFYLHIVVAFSCSVTSIQVWHIMKRSLKPKRSYLRCQLFNVVFLENSNVWACYGFFS